MNLPIEVVAGREEHICHNGGAGTRIPACGRSTLPGVISQRACTFYGARWMLAPIKDAIHLIHGPVGCAYYGQTVRRKDYLTLSTDMTEKDVIFGAGNKLMQSIIDAAAAFPAARAIFVYATCISGLIGEDIAAVCRQATGKLGKPVMVINCPGFYGVSQASGHDLAAAVLLEHLIGTAELTDPTPYDVNIVGEFDVQGDLAVITSLLQQLNLRVLCTFSGDAPVEKIARSHQAKLNILHCRRTGLELVKGMEERFGIPYLKVSFFGVEEASRALRAISDFFGLKESEDLIAREVERVQAATAELLPQLQGKRVALFFGGSRVASMARVFQELGMEVVMAGSQFGCAGDYQEAAAKTNKGSVLIDDAAENELVEFLSTTQPDLLVAGTKERFMAHKLGIPCLVFPQEMSPYAGYTGFINLAREVSSTIAAPVWRMVRGRLKKQPCVKVAVASKDGLTVDSHFGRASQFLVFQVEGDKMSLLELRENTSLLRPDDCGTDTAKEGISRTLAVLADCQVVICLKAGHCVKDRLTEGGIRVIEMEGSIQEGLRHCRERLQ